MSEFFSSLNAYIGVITRNDWSVNNIRICATSNAKNDCESKISEFPQHRNQTSLRAELNKPISIQTLTYFTSHVQVQNEYCITRDERRINNNFAMPYLQCNRPLISRQVK